MSESILERVARGDQQAVRECIDEFGGLVWAIARRMTRSRADAEDAVQEIFVDVWRSAARYDSVQGSEKVFITTIARRRLIDRIRRGRMNAMMARKRSKTCASRSTATTGKSVRKPSGRQRSSHGFGPSSARC
jgi:RNA polymerase sigma factor (sigma-70 family)